MTTLITRVFPFALLLMICAACDSPTSSMTEDEPSASTLLSASKADVYSEQTVSTFETTMYSFCANGGQGEDIAVRGTLTSRYHQVADGNGGFHISYHELLQNEGTGLTSGLRYKGRGTWNETFTLQAGATGSFTSMLTVNGQGAGNDFRVHVLRHITITPAGELKVELDSFRAECR